MAKQETIKYLTDLMATVQMAYFKGKHNDMWAQVGELTVHESGNPDSAAISIDLYNFDGDGKPVCDGLKPCTVTLGDGSTDIGWLFCMCYDPDDVTPLVFLFTPDEELGNNDGDIDLVPELVPEEVLTAITKWLEGSLAPDFSPKDEGSNDVTRAKDIIALWSDWCMGYNDENLWLDYMVKHPKGHCNRQHLQEKWHYCYDKYDSKAAMTMFWRELDDDNRTILTEYITTQWHKK